VTNRDSRCFEARDPLSYEPICGVHRIQLLRQELITANENPDGLGHLTPLLCPVSQQTMLRVQRI
jgi:hypothetical protein